MENRKNNGGLVALVIFLCLLVFGFGGYIVYDKALSDKKSDADNSENNTTNTNIDNNINISILSMNNPSIHTGGPNHVMTISGEMELSFDESKYPVVNIIGFCYGSNDEKYSVFAPGSGAVSLHSGETTYALVETINTDSDVIYADGTKKMWKDINWNDVNIKSCEIVELRAYSQIDGDEIVLTRKINYKKEFN